MDVREYRITRTGPKHFRYEDKDGKPVTKSTHQPKTKLGVDADGKSVMVEADYYAPVPGVQLIGYGIGDGLRNTIRLDAAGVKFLAHMGLVPVIAQDIRTEPSTPEPVHIPADWHTLSAKDRKSLAATLMGDADAADSLRAKDADAIIQEHVDGRKANTN